MAMVPSVVPRERAFHPLVRAARKAAASAAYCPACGSFDVRRSRRRSFFDQVFACLLLVPFRCRRCHARFLRLWRPAPETEPPPIAIQRLRQPLRITRPRSILILESDPSIRKLLRRFLDRRGYHTHVVIDPENLPVELRERQVDLLISADGLNCLDAVAHEHPNLKILTLSLDSLNGAEIPGRCAALAKPFSFEMFLESVDRLLAAGAHSNNGTRQ
jgi:CheY-like chemotaxis protein